MGSENVTRLIPGSRSRIYYSSVDLAHAEYSLVSLIPSFTLDVTLTPELTPLRYVRDLSRRCDSRAKAVIEWHPPRRGGIFHLEGLAAHPP